MLTFSSVPIKQDGAPTLERHWKALFSPQQHSFFLAWCWIDCWLRALPKDISLELLTCESTNAQPHFAAIFGKACPDLPARVLGHQTAFLNETGIHQYDDLVIEQNGFVGHLQNLTHPLHMSKLLKSLKANRICLHNISEDFRNQLRQVASKDNSVWHERANISHFVCLDQVRNSTSYLSLLSKNKRSQIKRSLTLLGGTGNIQIKQATSVAEAMIFFAEMVQLHQLEWNKRGKDGAFGNAFIFNFHQNLVTDHFDSGKVRIYRFANPDSTIGFIYGFISQNDFLYYQSGFAYSADNKTKPGLSCHTLLIEHLAAAGLNRYDFLAGNSAYKQSLGTHSYPMYSIDVYDQSIKSWLYLTLKQSKSLLRKARDLFRGRQAPAKT